MRARLSNFWYYYKVHVLVGVGIVIVVLVSVFAFPPGPPTGLTVDIFGPPVNSNQLATFQTEASAAVFAKSASPHDQVALDSIPFTGPINGQSQVTMKLMAEISAQSLDVVILRPADYHSFVTSGYLLDLRSQPGLASLASTALSKDGHGIELSKLPRSTGIESSDALLGVVSNSQHRSAAIRFIRWAIGQSPA